MCLVPTAKPGNCKISSALVNDMHIFFCELCSFDLIFFVRGGYMTLGSTFPAPINRF